MASSQKTTSVNTWETLTLRLRPGEWDLLVQVLREEGLPETPEGAKDLFFGWLREDESDEAEPTGIDKAFEYLKEHPEIISNVGALGKAALGKILKKKAGL